eukprot:13143849-Heterocapsa_arctica.AAC.1
MEDERKPWAKHELVQAVYIEELDCQMMTERKMDTEWVDCNAGVGTWRVCRNPICYRCDIIDKAELE